MNIHEILSDAVQKELEDINQLANNYDEVGLDVFVQNEPVINGENLVLTFIYGSKGVDKNIKVTFTKGNWKPIDLKSGKYEITIDEDFVSKLYEYLEKQPEVQKDLVEIEELLNKMVGTKLVVSRKVEFILSGNKLVWKK